MARSDTDHEWRQDDNATSQRGFDGTPDDGCRAEPQSFYPDDYGSAGHIRRTANGIICVPDRDGDDDTDTERATSDHRTVSQMIRDHQNKLADIYDKLDRELTESWRRS